MSDFNLNARRITEIVARIKYGPGQRVGDKWVVEPGKEVPPEDRPVEETQ